MSFFARNKPEDAHFTTYLPMTDEEIEELEENPYGGETALVAAKETKDGKGVSVISSKQLEEEMIQVAYAFLSKHLLHKNITVETQRVHKCLIKWNYDFRGEAIF